MFHRLALAINRSRFCRLGSRALVLAVCALMLIDLALALESEIPRLSFGLTVLLLAAFGLFEGGILFMIRHVFRKLPR